MGAFPPGYGGVTIKNLNLYTALCEIIEVSKIDFNRIKREDFKELIKFLLALLGRNNKFIIGVSGKNTRRNLCKVLYYLNRTAMQSSIIMIMGGTAATDISNDRAYTKYMSRYKKIYVETVGMMKTLEKAGLKNVAIYPNCRFRPKGVIEFTEHFNSSCVFFSLISPDKGVDEIIEAAKCLPDVEFHFYGPIKENYKQYFETVVASSNNMRYHGIYKGNDEQKYEELRQYDLLLLPTHWYAEGVPGILVEAKIAGLVPIVTDHNFNKEIVHNEIDGIVIPVGATTRMELIKSISSLKNDHERYLRLKKGSIASASDYYIDSYLKEISESLQ